MISVQMANEGAKATKVPGEVRQQTQHGLPTLGKAIRERANDREQNGLKDYLIVMYISNIQTCAVLPLYPGNESDYGNLPKNACKPSDARCSEIIVLRLL